MLQGSVDTRAQRRRAEDLAWSVDGVHDVQNRLRVRAGELERPAA
jgi:osmotically-inducible protein OsmY